MTATVSLYRARDGWRWRLVAPNGRILADSGEAYTRKAGAAKGCTRAAQAMCALVASVVQMGEAPKAGPARATRRAHA